MSLLTALGAAQAAPSTSAGSLGLTQSPQGSQDLASARIVAALGSASPESTPNRTQLPMGSIATANAQSSSASGPGFEWDSSLVLALAGVLALALISRRRLPR